MSKKSVLIFLFGLLLVGLMGRQAFAVPPGMDLSITERTASIDETTVQKPAFRSPNKQVGDSTYVICDLNVIYFGNAGGSDCWGYNPPGGDTYAIMGILSGLAFVNTTTMQIVDLVPGPESSCGNIRWRDIKTMGQYCYAVSECTGTNQGIMIIDMQFLPDSVHFIQSVPVQPGGYYTSHNLIIDSLMGFLYVEGTNGVNNSVHIHSLFNPANPTYINSFGPSGGIHDLYVRNDTAYLAEGWSPYFSIWDLSDKNTPNMLVRIPVASGGYVHNIWPTEDKRYIITTEETAHKTMKVWSIQNLANIQVVAEFLGPSSLAHNVHVMGNRLYVSHYESGIAVYDISNPASPIELGIFDTYPQAEGPNFNGCWGTYPWAPDGMIYGSNLDGSLFILRESMFLANDTLAGEEITAQQSEQIRIDISATNSQLVEDILIPLDWNGPYDLDLDSVSTVGLRTDYFQIKNFEDSDPVGKRAAYHLNAGSQPDLQPGSGPVVSLYFTVPAGASGDSNLVAFTSYSQFAAAFSGQCVSLAPELVPAVVRLGLPPCCVGIRGNADGDVLQELDVVDLSFLVDYLFNGGPVPACNEEGNADGSLDEQINVVDVTYVVDFLFRGGSAPPACP